ARAGREVLLAAGAIGSPQLLMLSGIGPAEHLLEVGLPVRHDLPGVGENLQDHPFLTLIWEVRDTRTLYGADKPKPMAEWLLRRSGPLTSTVAEALAFVRTRPGLPAADIQFHAGAVFFEKHGEEEFDGHAFTIAPTLLAPRSRGLVWLRSSSPDAKPRILVNALAEPEDMESMLAGIELAREIAAQEPLASTVIRELKPGADARGRDGLEDALRERLELVYHPVGTCRIGAADDGAAVVDPQLRVRGLEGLRVIDASVMPLIPGGNTNAPTIMIAERAADLIRGRVPVA
ncbi:MAG TPA: GMC oxidoreductase, partial [Thermoleophilaceae bacterium]